MAAKKWVKKCFLMTRQQQCVLQSSSTTKFFVKNHIIGEANKKGENSVCDNYRLFTMLTAVDNVGKSLKELHRDK